MIFIVASSSKRSSSVEDWDDGNRNNDRVSGEASQMDRTIPSSFRIEREIEKADWWPFRNSLNKSDRKKFLMGCLVYLSFISLPSYVVQLVRL